MMDLHEHYGVNLLAIFRLNHRLKADGIIVLHRA